MAQRKLNRDKIWERYYDKEINDQELKELLEKEEKRLEKRRKYLIGEPIKSFEELINQEVVFMYNRVVNKSFVLSQQFRMIVVEMVNGKIKKVIKKQGE